MNDGALGARANAWRRERGLSTDPGWITAKLLEETGEVARAVVGVFERREGRGDPLQEAAQTVIVLASLLNVVVPGADLYAAVEDEMRRLGAPGVVDPKPAPDIGVKTPERNIRSRTRGRFGDPDPRERDGGSLT